MRYMMGSKYFFKNKPHFKSHDTDYIEWVDDKDVKEKRIIRGQGKDIFQLRRKNKEELIEDALKSQLAMVVGKFLIPEFNNEINFTIEDLNKLKPLIEKLDDKHKYEETIYNYYLENKSFILTEEQLEEAKTIEPGESKEEFKEEIESAKEDLGDADLGADKEPEESKPEEPEAKEEKVEEEKSEETETEDEGSEGEETEKSEDEEWEEAQKLFKI